MTPRVHRARDRIEPRLTWKPLVRHRWRWRGANHQSVSGTRWFLFGVVPIASRKDR